MCRKDNAGDNRDANQRPQTTWAACVSWGEITPQGSLYLAGGPWEVVGFSILNAERPIVLFPVSTNRNPRAVCVEFSLPRLTMHFKFPPRSRYLLNWLSILSREDDNCFSSCGIRSWPMHVHALIFEKKNAGRPHMADRQRKNVTQGLPSQGGNPLIQRSCLCVT